MIGMTNGKFEFRSAGKCPLCKCETEFVATRDAPLDDQWHGLWFRNDLKCANCGSIPRERAIFVVLEMMFPNWRQLKIHESSPGSRGMSPKLRAECPGYVASQ